ncbi:MAG TPA: hypothetical protein VFK35_04880 [Candidatus Limnocylindrales bacterium]|nr:hypothetical protein [Candidatus Limnocylindrales bacterium]
MADLSHRAIRVVEQRPDVVHARLLELAARLRDEAPPIEPGTQAAQLLGMDGPLGIQVADRGPNRIELRTTQGRILANAVADLAPTADGRTGLTMAVDIKPDGFAANLMLGAALRMMPGVERKVIDGLEAGLDDLVTELAKSDEEWDADAWRPAGLGGAGRT